MKKVETRKSEVRFTTSDPKKMRNHYLVGDLNRTWHEDVLDKNTGKLLSVEKHETIAYRGDRINDALLQKIMFFQAEGGIKEVEVSNQKRIATVLVNEVLYIHKVVVVFKEPDFNTRKIPFILYATSVDNAIEIITDFCELYHTYPFYIEEAKVLNNLLVLTDDITLLAEAKPEKDNALLEDRITAVEYLKALDFKAVFADISTPPLRASHNKELDEAEKPVRSFYRISARIIFGEGEQQHVEEHAFIVDTYTAARAVILIKRKIESLLAERQKREAQNGREYTIEPFTVHIEESKILPVKYFVSREFSEAYLPKQTK